MYVLLLCLALLFVSPCLCYHLFDSRDSLVNSIVDACRTKTPNERAQCYTLLRCVMDNIPSEYTARWSAGSSVSAFIPTIVGLMSNSINEVTSIADESVILAITLSIASTTAFNSRFGDRSKRLSDTLLEEQREGRARIQTALSILKDLMAKSRRPRLWWQNSKLQVCAASLITVGVGVGVWYEVYQITRYGIAVFACPVKANVVLWVGISPLVTLLNVLCRSILFEIHTVNVDMRDARPRRYWVPAFTALNNYSIILPCPRDRFLS